MNVLVVNAGSSSLKLSIIDDSDHVVGSSERPLPAGAKGKDLAQPIATFLENAPPIDAAGHRIVHGGTRFTDPVLLDHTTEQTLRSLADLAPLHNPRSIAAVQALMEQRPRLPQVACFDTAFHATIPPKASTYAVPVHWREDWGIRRFGFHGLSHHWASRRASQILDRPVDNVRSITAHIGSGASLAAVANGRSVDTTMGFTPMEGLVMGTRSGSIDPGALLWVMRHGGLTAAQAESQLEGESGLLGLSCRSASLSEVIEAADAGDERSALAYEVYVYKMQTYIGSMTAAMGGVDALVFTGGAGEGSSRLRKDVCSAIEFLGFEIDTEENEKSGGDRIVSGAGSLKPVIVVHAREDLEINGHVRRTVLATHSSP